MARHEARYFRACSAELKKYCSCWTKNTALAGKKVNEPAKQALGLAKHDMAQWSAGLGWPGTMEQAVPGPILRHVGEHDTARHLQLGTTSAR